MDQVGCGPGKALGGPIRRYAGISHRRDLQGARTSLLPVPSLSTKDMLLWAQTASTESAFLVLQGPLEVMGESVQSKAFFCLFFN